VHERMKERFRQKTARVRAASGQVGARNYEGSSGQNSLDFGTPVMLE